MTDLQTKAVENSILSFMIEEEMSFEDFKTANSGFTLTEDYEGYDKDSIRVIVAERLYEFSVHLKAMNEAEKGN